jgi:sec-independent protein translocase protein TatB
MIVVFVVVLVVFGPQKLPELARGLGKLMAEFRKASTDFKSAFEEEMREMERQALQAERKKAAEVAAASAADTSQPAALAAPEGTESAPSEAADTSAVEGPVISPVAESIPRSSVDPAETSAETAGVTNSQDPPHDSHPPA